MLIVLLYMLFLVSVLSACMSFIQLYFTFLIYFCVTLFFVHAYAFFYCCCSFTALSYTRPLSFWWYSNRQLDYRIIKYDYYLIHCFRHRGKMSNFPARNEYTHTHTHTRCIVCFVLFFFVFNFIVESMCGFQCRFVLFTFFSQFVCDIGFPGMLNIQLAIQMKWKNANAIYYVQCLYTMQYIYIIFFLLLVRVR